jgi:MFS family permease
VPERNQHRAALGAVLISDLVSTLGSEMSAVALPWFVLVTTGSPTRMAGVMAAEFVGMGVLGIPSGHLTRTLGARRSLILADAVRAPMVALIPVLHWLHALDYAVLLVVGLVVGSCFPAYTAAQRVVVGTVVGLDEDRLTRIGGLLGAANESASFVGPGLGGLLVALVGSPWVLLVDAASYVVSLLVITIYVPGPQPAQAPPSDGVSAGLRWLAGEPQLRGQVAAAMIGSVGWTALMAVLPVAARRHYHGGARLAGAFIGAYGGGSVLGGLLAARSKRLAPRVSGLALVGVAVVTWLLVPVGPAWTIGACVAAFGVCNQLYYPRLFAALTLRPPAPLRGQVMTAATTSMSVPGPLGFVAAGLLLDHASVRAAFVLVAVMATLAAAVSVGQPLLARVDVEGLPAQETHQGHAGLDGEVDGE